MIEHPAGDCATRESWTPPTDAKSDGKRITRESGTQATVATKFRQHEERAGYDGSRLHRAGGIA